MKNNASVIFLHYHSHYRLLILIPAVPQTTFSTTTTSVSVFPHDIVRLGLTGILINASVYESLVIYNVIHLGY